MDPIDQQTIKDSAGSGRATATIRLYGSTSSSKTRSARSFPQLRMRGKRVADIGSGWGQIVGMLLTLGAAHVVAVEPSDAFAVLKENTKDHADKVTYLEVTADKLPVSPPVDLVVTYGVLHHILDPKPVVDACFRALKPGGKMNRVALRLGRQRRLPPACNADADGHEASAARRARGDERRAQRRDGCSICPSRSASACRSRDT